MVSPTQPLLSRVVRRLQLTTKQAGRGFYKGNRTGNIGKLNRHGHFTIDWTKVRTYVVPDLSNFNLTPFVPKNHESGHDEFATGARDQTRGQKYLEEWKVMNGSELPVEEPTK